MIMDLSNATIHSLSEQLKKRETTSRQLTEHLLEFTKKTNPLLNSFITICDDVALKQADAADKRIESGTNVTPLTGIPLGIKDLLLVKGIKSTCASKILSNYVAPYTATAVARLVEAGAVILGKTNQDEFAMGSSNEYSHFGAAKNPWNTEYIPGGSSGGSAVSVAAGQCIASLGTDTGGSIRQPSAMCATVGVKPTYGRVSRYGMVAFASSLDQIGPITKDVTDAAIMLNHICGHDASDSTSLDEKVPDFTKALENDIKGMKIGIPREYFIEGIETETSKAVNDAIQLLAKLGAEIVDISLPHTEYAVPCYYIVAPAEASANLARFDGIRYGYRAKDHGALRDMYEKTRAEGFGPEVTLRIIVGTYVLSSGYYDAYYLKAQKVRTLIMQDFLEAFKKVDIILTPTSPTPPFKLGEKTDDPIQMYLSDISRYRAILPGCPECRYLADSHLADYR
jgi:aspartyl-tRNA(Asn)/glutamyl-tRNA(Gln) amidotransferase subunit A